MVTKNPLTDERQVKRLGAKVTLASMHCQRTLELIDKGEIETALQSAQHAERLLKDAIERFWQPTPDKKEVDNY